MRQPRCARMEATLIVLVVAAVAACTPSVGDSAPAASFSAAGGAIEPAPPEDGQGPRSPEWTEVERLISEDKLEQARERVGAIRRAARQAGDEEEWTRALIEEVQLRTALHGYETAVRFLREEPWPEAALYRSILDLFYAHALVSYLQAYSWEINQRERVDTGEEIDLKSWTRDQLYDEAQRAFLEVWRRRQAWGNDSLGVLGEYLQQNTYPARIRGTLRDAVTYLYLELLRNSSLWRPSQQKELYRLDLEALVRGDPAVSPEVELDEPEVHPLVKIGALLDDLEAWHRRSRRPEAAFEAARERLQTLHGAFTRGEDRALIRAALRRRLEALGRRYEWWSVGQATLAEFVRDLGESDSLLQARAIALEGEQAHPDSIGGARCRHIVASIEAPGYSLQSMISDGLGRRSILVLHKNLSTLHFRAYRLDLMAQLEVSQDFNLLPAWREVPEILNGASPEVEWSAALPPTPDFQLHQSYVTPMVETPGLYLVVASARRDFAEDLNRQAAVNFLAGDLVLVTRFGDAQIEVTVRSGGSGEALPGVIVSLYRFDYRKGHRKVDEETTGADGRVSFSGSGRNRNSYFLLAQRGDELGLDPSYVGFHPRSTPGERSAALIYTDRSVYRPLQTIHWKVVAYHGGGEDSRFHTMPGSSLKVELVDPNREVVESRTVSTNRFGSATGEFSIPGGRLLGGWWLRSSLGGETAVQVEEYKRPTFEVTLREPAESLRLNRAATLGGEVRYYFGLPVVSGTVAWRVEREPLYPRWWYWFGRPTAEKETVAAGTSSLDEEGRFQLSFVPAADEREAASGVTYRYRLSVEVTDEGGETRSASRSFRLGFVTVEATVEGETSFFAPGAPAELTLRRTDLDGVPRPGKASWRLLALEQPEAALLPAEQPVDRAHGEEGEGYTTPGDLLRPRWDSSYAPEQVLRRWRDGPELAGGELEHGDDGTARLALPALPPGAYRVRYATRDEYGARYDTARELIVASEGTTRLALPALLLAERGSVPVGETARLLVHSALEHQEMVLELYRGGRRLERRRLSSEDGPQIVEIPIREAHRGGFGVRLSAVRDHQVMTLTGSVLVPWDDRRLQVEFASFRNRLRPGARERWRVRVTAADGEALEAGAAELLAYMYDRSLDLFAAHHPVSPLSLYPSWVAFGSLHSSLGSAGEIWQSDSRFVSLPGYPDLEVDRLRFYSGYGIGGFGRGLAFARARWAAPQQMADAMREGKGETVTVSAEAATEELEAPPGEPESRAEASSTEAAPAAAALRSDFSETAFWEPHLLTDEDGAVAFEFTVPDSVTEWNVWVHAVTRDLRAGSGSRQTRSIKELMVRPYLPRFLREGDRAELKVLVNNAGEEILSGRLQFEILDPESEASLLADFGLSAAETAAVPFEVPAGGGADLTFPVRVPARVGTVSFKVVARAGDFSDGELRPLPVLPGRMHLSQSRFVTLRDADRRELHFADLAAGDDPSLINERLVVTLDAQLFYSVLNALPYLVNYPYECTEQTLNRFLSTGILATLYDDYPAVARMAAKLSQRESRYESWIAEDPNRKMTLEETPWLVEARGGREAPEDLLNVLDPRIARAQRRSALAKLEKAQTSLGAFPWWPGGPPSPYMTLYILNGFSRALEFGVEVPRPMVVRAWGYMHRHYLDEMTRSMIAADCCWETVTFLNYVLSAYPDPSWTGGVFTAEEREQMLEFSFRHWRRHSPLLKAYLALTLERSGRRDDASLVFDSIMDSARSSRDEGTFWAPEDRAWLWYNDTIETHAFALRALIELEPDDGRRHGLVQWLLLNKKLNHWKSTRATAEVVYALIHYLEREGALAVREEARVAVGERRQEFLFEPDQYTGRSNQLVIIGEEIDPAAMATVLVEKETKGFMFASATWHFSTETLPAEARGDFFSVTRRYFKRLNTGEEWILQPLKPGAELVPGDQVEVHLSLRARHAAEYVHLRDPRAAGLEPESTTSRYKWELGIGWYEEIRDSGTNFFFDRLPVGEYTFKYRLRANVAGTFKVAPAQLQSMYAPEFAAYSSGAVLEID